jgi:uncharacterized protein YacL
MTQQTNSEELIVLNAPTDPLMLIQRTQQQQAETLAEINEQLQGISRRPLKITDFDMPFGSLVGFMVKAAIASIPAAIIVIILYFVIGFILGMFGLALGMSMR